MPSKSAIYKKMLAPKIQEIIRICNESSIPCFLSFGTDIKNDQFDLQVTTLLPEMFDNIPATKDKVFSDMVDLSTHNFTTCLKDSKHRVEFTVGSNDFAKNWVTNKN